MITPTQVQLSETDRTTIEALAEKRQRALEMVARINAAIQAYTNRMASDAELIDAGQGFELWQDETGEIYVRTKAGVEDNHAG